MSDLFTAESYHVVRLEPVPGTGDVEVSFGSRDGKVEGIMGLPARSGSRQIRVGDRATVRFLGGQPMRVDLNGRPYWPAP